MGEASNKERVTVTFSAEAHERLRAVTEGRPYHETRLGRVLLGDSAEILRRTIPDGSLDLIVTSPPYGLVRKKTYGNEDADDYCAWFRPFAMEFKRSLKDTGSLVVDIGGAWKKGLPTRSLYHFKLLLMLVEDFGFHLAQEFYWWNPSRLPTPAEWVTVRRIRVKDAIDCVWWLAPTPWPKASNRRVLQPYSDAMLSLLRNGYKPMLRPSGHDISDKFGINNGASIPPNLIAIANTESNSYYLRYCKEKGLKQHPARFPADLPEYFIRMLTDPGDLVMDPFAGSCVTGEVAERLSRRWVCVDNVEEYLEGAMGRFEPGLGRERTPASRDPSDASNYYRAARPGLLWNGGTDPPLDADGGRRRLRGSAPSTSPVSRT